MEVQFKDDLATEQECQMMTVHANKKNWLDQ